MTLPGHFATPEQYFEECLQFFEAYQEFYKYANTEILLHNVLNLINIKNLDHLNLHEDDFNLETVNDEYLKTFFGKLKRLQVTFDDFVEDKVCENVQSIGKRPASNKKIHEITYLAREIKEACESTGCNTVVDFGSGLGYLDQLLYDRASYKVLGLECSEDKYVAAKVRQRKYHGDSFDNVKYIRHTITEDSNANIKLFLEDKFVDPGEFCITGLHACADLTIDAINIFLKMSDARCLILMPCCYHLMATKEQGFKNFPLSASMKKTFEKYKGFRYMTVPFLRLGTHPPNLSEKLKDSVFNLLARGVLEQYASIHNCKIQRQKRKAVKTKITGYTFEKYIHDAANGGFAITKLEPIMAHGDTADQQEMMALWKQIDKTTKKKAGIYILMQNYMQPVIENVILLDRIMYLREHGIENCRCKRITNKNLSPRCMALMAFK